MFKWLFGEIEAPFNLRNSFTEVDEKTGETCWFDRTEYDCFTCGALGFTCQDILKCRYSPQVKVKRPNNRVVKI